ncbi:MAG: hypothetical protein AAF960_04335 [Bacteroidota bacterium]
MSEQTEEIRIYRLELVSFFWNFLLLMTLFFGLILLGLLVNYFFLILFAVFFLGITFFEKNAFLVKRKRTIELHAEYLKIIETNRVIRFQDVKWFRVDALNSPMINFLLREKGKLFPTHFATLKTAASYQSWVGFKKTTIRRIRKVNPDCPPWSATWQGRIFQKIMMVLIAIAVGIFIWEFPYVTILVAAFILYTIIKIFRK